MNDLDTSIEEAQALLASGHEAKAVQLLHDTLTATHDPELLQQIHELAAQAHERARGFQKIEWRKLMIESEPQDTDD
ncbi:MAG: hypothetical protein ABSB24_07630 [Gaiellaceae bacterium]|jgi:uncharacterized protein HemY